MKMRSDRKTVGAEQDDGTAQESEMVPLVTVPNSMAGHIQHILQAQGIPCWLAARGVAAGDAVMETKFMQDLIVKPDFVSVTQVNIWRDGGTISAVLVDAEGQQLPICFNGRIGSRPRGRLYIGATHHDAPAAKLVPLGDEVEHTIIKILKRHLDQEFTTKEQEALATLDGSSGFRDISRRDHHGYLLIHCIRRLEALSNGS